MSSNERAWLEEMLAEELDSRGDIAPPWARYPGIRAGHIGWRMGAGETWLILWGEWLSRQQWGRDDRLAYLSRHPAPKTWGYAAIRVVEPELEDDDDRDVEILDELATAGLLVDDASFLAWKRLHDASPPVPWARGDDLQTEARYGARELWFLARWAAETRSSGVLSRWLTQAPRAHGAWRTFRDALETGRTPARLPRDARERLGVLLAAHGHPPPPWAFGAPPESLTESFDDPASYADAWYVWVLDSFDDRATWRAYLDSGLEAPPAWCSAIERAFPWLS